jgi:hypothetical protein
MRLRVTFLRRKTVSLQSRPIIIYFHSSQCRLIPYLHQRPIFFKANSIHSSIVAILELIRGAQCLNGDNRWVYRVCFEKYWSLMKVRNQPTLRRMKIYYYWTNIRKWNYFNKRLVLGDTLISFWPLFKSLPRVVGPYTFSNLCQRLKGSLPLSLVATSADSVPPSNLVRIQS